MLRSNPYKAQPAQGPGQSLELMRDAAPWIVLCLLVAEDACLCSTQVTAEAPEVLVQLVSSIASAWVWTVDQRRGLFSGQPHPIPAAVDALSGSGSGAGSGGGGLEQQQGGVGDDATLQVGGLAMLAIKAYGLYWRPVLARCAITSIHTGRSVTS
jgi:hypothetical protein